MSGHLQRFCLAIAAAAIAGLSVLASAGWAAASGAGLKYEMKPAFGYTAMAPGSPYGIRAGGDCGPAFEGNLPVQMATPVNSDRELQERLDALVRDKYDGVLNRGNMDRFLKDMMREALQVYGKAAERIGFDCLPDATVRSLVAGEIDHLDCPCPPRPWIDGAAVELRAATGWAEEEEDPPFPIPLPGVGETVYGLAALSATGWAAADDDEEDPPFPLPLPGVGETGHGLVALSAAGFRAVH